MNDKEIKPSSGILSTEFLEFHVNMHGNLQPVHNALIQCTQWNSIFFQQSMQDFLIATPDKKNFQTAHLRED